MRTRLALFYADYLVLVALTDRPDGTMRVFELAETLGWEKSRLSHQVSRMTERGLLTKKKCDSDRRGAYVAFSRRGRRELVAAALGHLRAVRRLFVVRLTPQQLASITEVAEEVLRGFQDATPG